MVDNTPLRVLVLEDPVGELVELREVADLGTREPSHRDAAHAVGAFRVLVLPRRVFARARGQHIDLVALGEPLGDEPAMIFGAAENLGAVPLGNKRNLHV